MSSKRRDKFQRTSVFPAPLAAILEVSDYNVILVDWSGADSINYVGSRLLVSSLGQLVGQLIQQLVQVGGLEYSDLHLIGHSLGAHVMGFAGRTAGLGSQGRITGTNITTPVCTCPHLPAPARTCPQVSRSPPAEHALRQ